MKTFHILAILATFALAVDAVDYCSIPCDGSKHIGCDNSGKMGSKCSPDAKLLEFDATLIKAVLSKHNEVRNTIASGTMKPFEPALRMKVMEWDPELAKLATLTAMQCNSMDNSCHNTEKFPQSGKNSYHSVSHGELPTSLTAILEGINYWYSERERVSMADINNCPKQLGWVGDFTLMVAENNSHVGCGGSTFVSDGVNITMLICHYATRNVIGQPIYQTSEGAASGCKVKGSWYTNLCRS